jgi:hypothetical protein
MLSFDYTVSSGEHHDIMSGHRSSSPQPIEIRNGSGPPHDEDDGNDEKFDRRASKSFTIDAILSSCSTNTCE